MIHRNIKVTKKMKHALHRAYGKQELIGILHAAFRKASYSYPSGSGIDIGTVYAEVYGAARERGIDCVIGNMGKYCDEILTKGYPGHYLALEGERGDPSHLKNLV